MTHAREGGDEAYEGTWELKGKEILLKFNNGREEKLLIDADKDGDAILWYSFFEKHDGCLMKNLKNNNVNNEGESITQEEIKETIKWEEHKVQNIWLTYPNDWEFEEGTEASNITKNEDVITICEEIWVDDTELYLLENELDNNIVESLKDKGTLTKERKYIMNQEWSLMYVRPKDGREAEVIFMTTIKNGWAYVVRILSNGDNKTEIYNILDTITIPEG